MNRPNPIKKGNLVLAGLIICLISACSFGAIRSGLISSLTGLKGTVESALSDSTQTGSLPQETAAEDDQIQAVEVSATRTEMIPRTEESLASAGGVLSSSPTVFSPEADKETAPAVLFTDQPFVAGETETAELSVSETVTGLVPADAAMTDTSQPDLPATATATPVVKTMAATDTVGATAVGQPAISYQIGATKTVVPEKKDAATVPATAAGQPGVSYQIGATKTVVLGKKDVATVLPTSTPAEISSFVEVLPSKTVSRTPETRTAEPSRTASVTPGRAQETLIVLANTAQPAVSATPDPSRAAAFGTPQPSLTPASTDAEPEELPASTEIPVQTMDGTQAPVLSPDLGETKTVISEVFITTLPVYPDQGISSVSPVGTQVVAVPVVGKEVPLVQISPISESDQAFLDSIPQVLEPDKGTGIAEATGSLTPNSVDRFVISVQSGQHLNVRLSSGDPDKAFLRIIGADNGIIYLSKAVRPTNWNIDAFLSQRYLIEVVTRDEPASYVLTVAISQ